MPVLTRYLLAAIGARLADEGARVAIVLLAIEQTGRASVGGLLVAALMVPHVAAAPLAGAAADRARRRKPLYLSAFVIYALSLTGAALLVGPVTWAAAILLLTGGCVAPLLFGGLSSLLRELAPGDAGRAFGYDATTYSVAGITGPALAAVVAGFAGPAWSLVTLGAFALLGALAFLTLPLGMRPSWVRPERISRPFSAVSVMIRKPRLAAVTATTGISQFGFGALPLAAAAIATARHDPPLTGLIMAVTAAGSLVGSLLTTRIPVVHRHPERTLLICTAAMSVAFLPPVFLPGTWPLLAAAGLLMGPTTVALFSVRDRESPPEVRTQVFTLGAGIKVTSAAAGAAAGGLLSGAGSAPLLAVIAGGQLVAALTGVLILRRGRRPGDDHENSALIDSRPRGNVVPKN
ncbi:MFS family permease [Actinoplanes lutulentus]|uniref:Putative MFS family arabinose efflux permease n=1 Tax=Actinoplanes lutulentus TaxID=1287878 RepID=A0A327Z0M2_9ACTN|nr:MFS transporter [Actinoplanes lutulentus]MBB2947645.1 MFS family permease [Actinoplanes lutulentus]RAK27701.1 putative MFS family arabinose efflux permease [Actinoplanes lutulentus]